MDWTEIGRVAAENLTPIALIILVGIVGAATKVGLAYLEKWTGAQVSKAQREMIVDLVDDAIYFVEEQARKALKAADKTPDSDTKLELAFKYVVDHMKAQGLPGMARDRLVEMIESNLMYWRDPDDFSMSKRQSIISDARWHCDCGWDGPQANLDKGCCPSCGQRLEPDDTETTELDLPKVEKGKLIGGKS